MCWLRYGLDLNLHPIERFSCGKGLRAFPRDNWRWKSLVSVWRHLSLSWSGVTMTAGPLRGMLNYVGRKKTAKLVSVCCRSWSASRRAIDSYIGTVECS